MRIYDYTEKFDIKDFNTDHELVLNNVMSNMKAIPDDEIMAFSKDNNVIFVRKKDLEELWTKFAEVVIPEPNLELNDFHDEYGDMFFRYTAKQIFGKHWAKIRYFCSFIETTYDIYRGEI